MAGTAARAEALLGQGVVSTTSVAGGDICTSTRLRLTDGHNAIIKTRPQAPAAMFIREAEGCAGSPRPAAPACPRCWPSPRTACPRWVEPGKPTPDAAERFGRDLAATHAAGADDVRRRVRWVHRARTVAQPPAADVARVLRVAARHALRTCCGRPSGADFRGGRDDRGRDAPHPRLRRTRGAARPHPRRPAGPATSCGAPTATSGSSTRLPMADTARPTSRCSRCSACPICSASSTHTTKQRRWRTVEGPGPAAPAAPAARARRDVRRHLRRPRRVRRPVTPGRHRLRAGRLSKSQGPRAH